MLFGNDFDEIKINTTNGKMYYLGEEILKQYIDEYENEYIMTKGFNRFYLYKKAIYGNFYNQVAETKSSIDKYIEINKLKEVD